MPDTNKDQTKNVRSQPVTGREVAPVSASHEDGTFGNKVATVAAVGLGVALIEAELLPGMLIGVAAMMAPNLLPRIGRALRPLVKGTVRAGYTLTERAREMAAEAGEHMEDIVAEVKAEQGGNIVTPAGEPARG